MELQRGDVIEILYRMPVGLRPDQPMRERWLTATIVDCDSHGRPFARLADGQLTDIRVFMTWRHVRHATFSRFELVA